MTGETLKKLREERRLTQEEVARRAGLSQVALSRIETRRTSLGVDDFMQIAKALGYRPGDLLENSAGLYADMRPILEQLRTVPPPARSRILRVVEEIVGVREDAIVETQPDNVVQFKLPLEEPKAISDESMDRLTAVMKRAGAEPRKAARGPEREVRFYGLASAGEGIEFLDEIPEEYRQIPQWAWRKGARGVFKAAGDSMMDVGIFPNFIMFVKPTPRPVNGRICICTVNQKVYVKRVKLDEHGVLVQLQSKNSAYSPIDITPDDQVDFFGEVVGVAGDM